MTPELARVVVVTGLSGAGKSTALRTLADLGYYCVDNLPPLLVAETVRVCAAGGVLPIALGLDVRVGAFLAEALPAIEALEARPERLCVVFLDAADDVLVRRYSETRRPHPLLARAARAAEGGTAPARPALAVLDGIALERERLAAIRSRADVTIDTSHRSVHELRREVAARFAPTPTAGARLVARFLSFGFKFGVPLDADLVFDVRFLENPHFVRELRDQSGRDPAVRAFVLGSPDCAELLDRLEGLLGFVVPRYEREGKSYLTVAVGCTGGRHRSVAVAEALAERLGARADMRIGVVHRDLAREGTLTEVMAPAGSRPRPTSDGDPAEPGRAGSDEGDFP